MICWFIYKYGVGRVLAVWDSSLFAIFVNSVQCFRNIYSITARNPLQKPQDLHLVHGWMLNSSRYNVLQINAESWIFQQLVLNLPLNGLGSHISLFCYTMLQCSSKNNYSWEKAINSPHLMDKTCQNYNFLDKWLS